MTADAMEEGDIRRSVSVVSKAQADGLASAEDAEVLGMFTTHSGLDI